MRELLSRERSFLLRYFRDNRWMLAISNVLFLCLYGPWLFNVSPRVDTTLFIQFPHSVYNWREIGRQGFLFTENIWGISAFNPFLYTFFGFVMISLGATLFGYLFWRAGQGNGPAFSAFVLLGFVSPILTELFYFDILLFQAGWAYVVTAAACGLAHAAITRKSFAAGAASVFCMIWSFSSYQAFVILYIASVTGFFLLYFRRRIEDAEALGFRDWIRYIAMHIGLFLLAFLLNTAITKIWFSGSDYLYGQVYWKTMGVGAVLRSITHTVRDDLFRRNVFYSRFFFALILVVLLASFLDIRRKRVDIGSRILYIAAAAALQLCPFLIIAYIGHEPTIRAQLVYPFVLGLDLLFLLTRRYEKKAIRIAVCVLSAALIWGQIKTVERLVYTDVIRARDDVRLMAEIEPAVHALSDEKDVAFVGSYTGSLNPACLKGELIGLSLFNFCPHVGTTYWNSTNVACEATRALGFTLEALPEERMMDARVAAADMPCWPAAGSVKDAGDFVVVKLSEDEWPEEVEAYAPGTYKLELTASISEDNREIAVSLNGYEDESVVLFPVWSEENDQDDLVWYKAEKQADGSWSCKVDLSKHGTTGRIIVQAYALRGQESVFIREIFIAADKAS